MATFTLGSILATPGALDLCISERVSAADYIKRHAAGDWGNIDREDWEANQAALLDEGRLFSAYSLPSGARLWIITEADRSATTILLPEEY